MMTTGDDLDDDDDDHDPDDPDDDDHDDDQLIYSLCSGYHLVYHHSRCSRGLYRVIGGSSPPLPE